MASILDLSNEVRAESFAGLSKDEGKQLIELLRRVHANLSERVLPLAAEFSDLDETAKLTPGVKPEPSPVGARH
ncbi:MAG: hypothetical protein JO227_01655 [Acetobacteraceae bacterium]|nr:hypothetical protein [Acetobacteraceae bacterium]